MNKSLIRSIICLVAALLIAAGVGIYRHYYHIPAELACSRDYVAGEADIRGSVDPQAWLNLGTDYAIGANREGSAVFRDPAAAMSALKAEYADALEAIRTAHGLAPLSQFNYELYGTYGWQTESQADTAFVSRFMDIYENSFRRTAE